MNEHPRKSMEASRSEEPCQRWRWRELAESTCLCVSHLVMAKGGWRNFFRSLNWQMFMIYIFFVSLFCCYYVGFEFFFRKWGVTRHESGNGMAELIFKWLTKPHYNRSSIKKKMYLGRLLSKNMNDCVEISVVVEETKKLTMFCLEERGAGDTASKSYVRRFMCYVMMALFSPSFW